MPHDILDDLLLRDAHIQTVKPMLWASLALAVTGLLGLLFKSMPLTIVGWIGSWIAGPTALSRLAPALGTSPLLKYPLFIGCAMPGLSLAAPVYGLMASRSLQQTAQQALRQHEARERRREREARVQPAAAATASAAASAAAAAAAAAPRSAVEALPVLRLVAGGIGDGAELQLRIKSLPPGMTVPPDAELPPVRASHDVFGVGYHLDAGSHWVSVSRQEMKDAGLSLDQLHQRSLANLTKLVKGKPGLRVIGDPAQASYRGLLLDGDHEACLVLLDALWDQVLKPHTPNGAVVSIPSRDVLAFCDAHSKEGIAQLREAAARVGPDAKGALSQQLLLRRQGRWTVFEG